jgi:hypothetical protein
MQGRADAQCKAKQISNARQGKADAEGKPDAQCKAR